MNGFVFFACLFGFPETKWHRMHPDELRAKGMVPSEHPSELPSLERHTVDEIEREKKNKKQEESNTASTMLDLSQTATAVRDPFLGKGTPSKQQFSLFQPNANPFRSILQDIWIPWKLFAFPIVEFASFVVSWSASSFLTLNLTQSQVFAAPPYNFSSNSIGYTNFAIVAGAAIGLATAGPLSDWISMRATRKNKGVREPEMRLPTMIPYVLIMMLGNFIVAFGYQNSWDWRVRNPLSQVARSLVQFVMLLFKGPRFSLLKDLYELRVKITDSRSLDHCHNRLHLRRNPSRRSPVHRLHIRR